MSCLYHSRSASSLGIFDCCGSICSPTIMASDRIVRFSLGWILLEVELGQSLLLIDFVAFLVAGTFVHQIYSADLGSGAFGSEARQTSHSDHDNH